MYELVISGVLVALTAWKRHGFLRLGVRGLCVVAILAALASVGRYLSQALYPSVQPASFIVMICGGALGGAAGLYCGLLVALISGVFTGFGPWTVWQMLFWGLMGLLAARPIRAGTVWRVAYGLAWGFIFGWGLNLWFPLAGFVPVTWGYYLASCVASFPMDLAHSVTNAVLLLTCGGFMMRYTSRFGALDNRNNTIKGVQ